MHTESECPCRCSVCSWCPGVGHASHVGDLDAGVPSDGAPLGPGRGLVPGVPGQGAVAAVAAQVPAVACLGAETCRRLHHTRRCTSSVFTLKEEATPPPPPTRPPACCHFSILSFCLLDPLSTSADCARAAHLLLLLTLCGILGAICWTLPYVSIFQG